MVRKGWPPGRPSDPAAIKLPALRASGGFAASARSLTVPEGRPGGWDTLANPHKTREAN